MHRSNTDAGRSPSIGTARTGRFFSTLRFLGVAFSINIQAVIEYRVSFLVQVFGMMLNNGAFALFWAVLVARTGGVGGYGFSDIMFVWAIVSTAFGLAHMVFGNVRSLGRIIVEGDLDSYLLQPRSVLLNLLVSRTIVSAWGDFIYGYIVIAALPGFDLERLLLFSCLALSGAIIFTAVLVIVESLAFFLGDAGALSGAALEFLLSFSLYPESIHGAATKWMLYSLIPSAFIAFLPLRIFTRLDWPALPLLFGLAVLYAALAWGIFRLGLRRYESGNRMGMRL